MALPIILVVEDDLPIANLLTQVLQAGGYEVLNAQSGAEALRLGRLHQREIALLLCDVVLRDRSGPDVALRIGELSPQMRTLFTSGYPLENLAERGLLTPETLRNENTFYIGKPFWPNELLRLVNGILPMMDVATTGTEEAGGARVRAAH
jgi:DNA-binding response OmpR family regulator